VAPRLGTAAIGDDDSLCVGIDPDVSSDDDGCLKHRLSPRKNIPWDEIEEQRLRVYKEEGKAWKWIFKKFPNRTEPAIRTRWTILQNRSG
jgi:hypothetical protein